MKRLMLLATAGIAISAMTLSARAETLPAGQVDFGAFTPPTKGGEFVEVNLTSSLISLASRLVEKEQPDVAKLLAGLQLVQVHVVSLDDQNRPELESKAQKMRKELDSTGWEKIVTVQQQAQNVAIYLKTHNKSSVQGLVVMVFDGEKQAVFVNVVGDIQPDKLSLLGEKLHLDPLKKIGQVTSK